MRIRVKFDDGSSDDPVTYEVAEVVIENYDGIAVVVHPADGELRIKEEVAS